MNSCHQPFMFSIIIHNVTLGAAERMRWRRLIAPAFLLTAIGRVAWERVRAWRVRRDSIKRLSRRRKKRARYNGWKWDDSAGDSTSAAADVLALLKTTAVNYSVPEVPNYSRKAYLLTEAERGFLNALEKALEQRYRVFVKVRVADVLEPEAAPHTYERRNGFKLISRRHFDYLLCDLEELTIRCAIALEGASPKSEQRRERDEFLNQACRKAHLPLLRFPAESEYDSAIIRDTLFKALGPDPQETEESQ
jgi:hypothetical protein